MNSRVQVIQAFLQSHGWGQARRVPMSADASFRSYERLLDDGGVDTAVLMNAPPANNEGVDIFSAIADHLRGCGYSAPRILAEDTNHGLMLLEDLGDDLFARLCADRQELESPLYAAAVDLLADLARRPLPGGLPPYSDAFYRSEVEHLPNWYLRALTGGPDAALTGQLADLVSQACAAIAPPAPVMVLRDYHAENLIWLPDRAGLARVGLLDFQGAMRGHPAYDLVSLLEDARRDTGPALQRAMKQRYAAATGTDPAVLERACCTLGAQRNLKIIGLFARLALRDGKDGYLDLIPRVWGHLMQDLSHPDLGPLHDWVGQHVPEPTPANLSAIRRRRDAS